MDPDYILSLLRSTHRALILGHTEAAITLLENGLDDSEQLAGERMFVASQRLVLTERMAAVLKLGSIKP